MEIRFEKLTPERIDDFFHFFDHDAFSDHEEWAGCYCLESHIKETAEEKFTREVRRQKAKALILDGTMTGYLLYDGATVAGWCNAGDKGTYGPICANEAYFTEPPEQGRIKIIYCIDIAPNYRGRGIADLIVERVTADAKEEGYSYLEGYPFVDETLAYQYKGPLRLYEKHGFQPYRKNEWFYVMRKALK